MVLSVGYYVLYGFECTLFDEMMGPVAYEFWQLLHHTPTNVGYHGHMGATVFLTLRPCFGAQGRVHMFKTDNVRKAGIVVLLFNTVTLV